MLTLVSEGAHLTFCCGHGPVTTLPAVVHMELDGLLRLREDVLVDTAAVTAFWLLLPGGRSQHAPRLLAMALLMVVLVCDKAVFLRLDVGQLTEGLLYLLHLTVLSKLLVGIFFGPCDPLEGAASCVLVRLGLAMFARYG